MTTEYLYKYRGYEVMERGSTVIYSRFRHGRLVVVTADETTHNLLFAEGMISDPRNNYEISDRGHSMTKIECKIKMPFERIAVASIGAYERHQLSEDHMGRHGRNGHPYQGQGLPVIYF